MMRQFCSYCDKDRRFTLQKAILRKSEAGKPEVVKLDTVEERLCEFHWREYVAKQGGI